ncbi:ACBP1, partial [Symbiodinium microadriaticum]
DQKLQFYGLYKQSTIGNVNTKQPWSINMVAKAKWDAWKAYEGFPQKSAAMAYVFLADQLEAEDPTKKSGQELIREAGENAMAVTVSTFADPLQGDSALAEWTNEERIFKAVVDGDVEAVRNCVAAGLDPSLRDSERMTPLHYAADRGHTDVLNYLIDAGADLNAQDGDGQSAVMVAVMCSNKDIVQLLVSAGADMTLRNNDGERALDLIDDSDDSEEIRVLVS